MDKSKFNIRDANPLTELSEIRFDVSQVEEIFELRCRLRFGRMHYEYKDREFEVGVSRAFLRLSLEGCESTLDSSYGENVLNSVVDNTSADTKLAAGANITGNVTSGVGVGAGVGASAEVRHSSSQSSIRLPVKALPNNSWEVEPQKVTGEASTIIEGTAIPGEVLCKLRRKQGGNRLAIIGEVQVSKNSVKVTSKGGNRLLKSMTEWQNKDAIVSQILRKAIQREASGVLSARSTSSVVIARCEAYEE